MSWLLQHNQFMHLTNYSVNRHNESFDNDDSCDKGSKRTIKFFNAWLTARGYSVNDLWARIIVSDLILYMWLATPIHSFGSSLSHEQCR